LHPRDRLVQPAQGRVLLSHRAVEDMMLLSLYRGSADKSSGNGMPSARMRVEATECPQKSLQRSVPPVAGTPRWKGS
jgi:hypothetical protein